MPPLTDWMRSHRATTIAVIGVVAVIILGVAFLAVAKATDQSSFCGSSCHEMGPYHSAWSNGPHKDIACVECHVDSGTVPRLTHKFEALGEVVSHVKGDTTFPRATPPAVPDERCLRCHTSITPSTPGFNHTDHAKRGPCVSCHREAGHSVSISALQQAGILNATTAQSQVASSTETSKAVVDGGSADLANHVTVACSRCHKMAETACSACHTPKHPARGECSTCHKPGVKFVFTHPKGGVDCASCHKPPAAHAATSAQDCSRCHERVGVDWKHTHAAAGGCGACHTRPAKHRAGDCFGCHKKPGVTWAFTHPKSGNCASCHDRPARHRAGACQTCHRNAGKNWAFAHPSSAASCAACHARPAGHRSGSCQTCHRNAGVSWRFNHPTSHSCATCHNRPSKHASGSCYNCHKRPGSSWAFTHPGIGSNCIGCHPRPAGMPAGQCSNCHRKPGVSWAFTHPRIPGGEHTSHSFACSNCHPNGYSTHTCIKCHDSASGGD